MSKVVVALPEGMIRRSVIGGLLAAASYAMMQTLWALLLDHQILSMEKLYPAVCVSAGLAAFLGCGYSVLKGRGSGMLSISAVVVVFLAITVLVALLTGDSVEVERGLVGVGLSMAAGGLAAALAGDVVLKKRSKKRRKKRRTGYV